MKRLVKRFGILLLVFIASLTVYFIWSQNSINKESTIYTLIDEPSLPVVYVNVYGREMNCLHGYIPEMGNAVSRDTLTVLPEDRNLSLRIAEYGNTITGIQYEIRSLDMERLVERTVLDHWNSKDGSAVVKLPIQNMLNKEQEYLLQLSVEMEEKTAHYYTRIVWSDHGYAKDMIDLAADFSVKTFDYEQAQSLVTYLETSDTESNASFGHATLKSSFSHITWDGLDMQMVGDISVFLKDFNGIMGQIQVCYLASLESGDGQSDVYEVEDNYTMKWNAQRIYMMNFERRANQVFSGERDLFSGKRILLGITNEDKIQSEKSESGQFIAFESSRSLWCYDQKNQDAVKIFSFRSGEDDGVRSNYKQHDIKILSVHNDGTVDFLVYGYMNRGQHEGYNGVVLYRYSQDEEVIQEIFFIPARASYEEIRSDVSQLSYLGGNDMMYLLLRSNIYGIDLKSNESMSVAKGVDEGSFAVSPQGNRLAWMEGNKPYGSQTIHVMDLDTAQKQEIQSENNEYIRVLGFVGSDLIYGISHGGDQWVENNRIIAYPMYGMRIIGDDMSIENTYEKENVYIYDVSVENSRIHLKQAVKTGENTFIPQNEDIIVCNEDFGIDPLKGIGWYASADRGRLYFVEMDQEISNSRRISIDAPKTVSYEHAGTLSLNEEQRVQPQIDFYAYSGGSFRGQTGSFAQAVNLAYDQMGTVTDQNYRMIWNRVNRQGAAAIKNPMEPARKMFKYLEDFDGNTYYEDDKLLLIDARGCNLNQVLYFIGKGCPVIAYTGSGGFLLVSGFDQYNVTLYDPQTGESWKMGQNDASEYFKSNQNDFICGLFLE